jgi:hypothetical protein
VRTEGGQNTCCEFAGQEARFLPMALQLKCLLLRLAVVAVGMAQVVGVHAGYLCGCTGQRSAQAECEPMLCHPHQVDLNGCASALETEACSEHDTPEPAQNRHDHSHSEIRETLMVTGVPTALTLPPVVFVELPPVFRTWDAVASLTSGGGVKRSQPPWDGSPPMPLLVARTMVMLV